jgi:putative oxidoreductase
MTDPRPGGFGSAVTSFWGHWLHSWLALPCRLWVGVIWILAAWHKILYPAKFALSIATYQILPLEYINLLAITLPWLELITGVTIIVGFWTRASALCVAGMAVMFIVALIMAIRGQVQMTSCGCFAADAEAAMKTIGWDYVYRDVAYLAAAGYVALFDGGRIGVDGLLERRKET